jgi:hypothetical protein
MVNGEGRTDSYEVGKKKKKFLIFGLKNRAIAWIKAGSLSLELTL